MEKFSATQLNLLRTRTRESEETFTFCIGNEAGDLDSIVSCFAASYWYANEKQVKNVIACMPFNREDFKLRRDAVLVFNDWKKDEHDAPIELLFLDDAKHFVNPKVDNVVLTDSNKTGFHIHELFTGSATIRVVGILDHHVDEGFYKDINPRIIMRDCGSASSLFSLVYPKLDNAELKAMLFNTILIDTRNLKKDKSFPIDETALKWCAVSGDSPEFRTERFNKLLSARYDTSSFTLNDCFRVDYKEFVAICQDATKIRVGLSNVFDPLEVLVAKRESKASFVEDVIAFMKSKNLSLYIAVFAHVEKNKSVEKAGGKKVKEFKSVVMCSQSDKLIKHVSDRLIHFDKSNFSESYLNDDLCKAQRIDLKGFGVKTHPQLLFGNKHVTAYTLRKKITRKTLVPALLEIIKTMPGFLM